MNKHWQDIVFLFVSSVILVASVLALSWCMEHWNASESPKPASILQGFVYDDHANKANADLKHACELRGYAAGLYLVADGIDNPTTDQVLAKADALEASEQQKKH